jgi:septal ring factor EnvC (AmiA/AmiB activator)
MHDLFHDDEFWIAGVKIAHNRGAEGTSESQTQPQLPSNQTVSKSAARPRQGPGFAISYVLMTTTLQAPPPPVREQSPQHQQTQAKLAQLEQLLKQGRTHLQDLRSQLEHAKREREELRGKLDSAQAERDDVEEKRDQMAYLLNELRADRDRIADQLKSTQSDRMSLEEKLGDTEGDVEQLRAGADRALALAREIIDLYEQPIPAITPSTTDN